MSIASYRRPARFYLLSTFIPWVFWFMAAYLSHKHPSTGPQAVSAGLLALVGLISPMLIAFSMMGSDPELRRDLLKRAFTFNGLSTPYILTACFLMLGSILLAQSISLLFGHSADQFSFADTTSFSFGLFPAWFLLFLAPVFEELAWHTYGTDCLRARFNLLTTSLIFGVFWVVWHMPLAFINDYYHSNVVVTGWIYSLNFAISLFPFVILMNWLYFKTNRNILVPIIFHITAGLFNELFQTHPDSKVIQTLLLLVLSLYLIHKERHFFFDRAVPAQKKG